MDPEENEVDTTVESEDDGLGVPYEEALEPLDTDADVTETESTDSEGSVSPAWDGVLKHLPQEFHKLVQPELSTWDKNFAKVQSDYAPYKPLLENNVKYEDVESAIQLAKWVSSDPAAVYAELGRRFGFGKEQGQEQEKKQEEEEEELEELDLSPVNPKLTQLEQTVQSMQKMIDDRANQDRETQEREKAAREIETEWSGIETQIKSKLNPDVRKEITRRAIAIGDETGNYSLTEGYKDYARFVNQVRNSRANNSAPRVLSGNGGQPVTKKPIGQMTESERVDYIASMAEALAKE